MFPTQTHLKDKVLKSGIYMWGLGIGVCGFGFGILYRVRVHFGGVGIRLAKGALPDLPTADAHPPNSQTEEGHVVKDFCGDQDPTTSDLYLGFRL